MSLWHAEGRKSQNECECLIILTHQLLFMPRHFQQNILYTELYILQMLFFTGNPLSCTIERPGRARSNPGLLLPNCITLEEAPYLAESPLSGSRRGAKTARTKGDLSCYLRGVCMQQYVVRTLCRTAGSRSLLSPWWLYVIPGKSFYALRLVFSPLKMGVITLPCWHPTVATKQSTIWFLGKRTKYPTGEAADSKTETGKDQGETRTSSCAAKQGKGQQLMETRQRTSLKIKSEKIWAL